MNIIAVKIIKHIEYWMQNEMNVVGFLIIGLILFISLTFIDEIIKVFLRIYWKYKKWNQGDPE